MTEQNPEQYDPAAYTVDEVNAHLAEVDETERARILAAEAARGEDARKGIVGQDGPEPEADATHAEDRRDLVKDNANEDGTFGTLTEGPEGFDVKPADESAPEGVDTDAAAGLVIATGDDASRYTGDRPATMADQEAPCLEGEHCRRGYAGTLPNEGNREDLTIQGVLKRQD